MARPQDSGWSEAELALAERLWGEGFSSAAIATALRNELGRLRSRSAVCAMMMRDRARFPKRGGRAALSDHAVQHRRATAQRAPHPGNIRAKRAARAQDPAYRAPAPAERAEAPHPHVYDGASRAVPLLRLGACDCRFPVNDAGPGETHLFCAAPAQPGGPYCTHHAARAHDRPAVPEAAE